MYKPGHILSKKSSRQHLVFTMPSSFFFVQPSTENKIRQESYHNYIRCTTNKRIIHNHNAYTIQTNLVE
jgi:hypothetical protein